MVTLLDYLFKLSVPEISGLIDGMTSLQELVSKAELAKKQRTDKGVSQSKLEDTINKILESMPEVSEIYNQILTISETMAAMPRATYRHNVYQCFIAARLVNGDPPFVAGVVAAGQGKTFVMLLVARYYITHRGKTVLSLCTSSELVYKQLQADVLRHKPTNGLINVLHAHDFRKVMGEVVIIDEGDIYLRRTALLWHNLNLGGLASLRNK